MHGGGDWQHTCSSLVAGVEFQFGTCEWFLGNLPSDKEEQPVWNIADLNWPSRLPRLLWISRNCPLCSSIEFKAA